MDSKIAKQAALQMFAEHISRPLDVTRLLEQCLDRDYWGQLNPSLRIGGDESEAVVAAEIDERRTQNIARRFTKEGYLQIEPIVPDAMVQRMREGVETVRAAGWPAVFSFVYDEFWSIARGGGVDQVLTAILGPGYKQLPNMWTHYVSPQRGASGWTPHKDGEMLSLWIPLSDATLDNGCMYLIPKNRMVENVSSHWFDSPTIAFGELVSLLQQSRAVPAQAGSVLGWGKDVVHWGSTVTRTGTPRIAISFEYTTVHHESRQDERPLLDVDGPLPTFPQRLQHIGHAILSYSDAFEPLVRRYEAVARRLSGSQPPRQ